MLSTEAQEIVHAVNRYIQKHNGQCAVAISVQAFGQENEVVDDWGVLMGQVNTLRTVVDAFQGRLEQCDDGEGIGADVDMPIPQENAVLREDLEDLWHECHLTANHHLVVNKCNGCDDNPTPHYSFRLTKDGEEYTANVKLQSAIDRIVQCYEFDHLEAWPCCNDCGSVLFAREIDGKLHDSVVGDDGLIEDVPTTGVERAS